jgi:hypothetical protein
MDKARFFFGLLLGMGLAASARAQEIKDNNCVVCHADQWEQMKESIHTRHQITCDRCHGGDPAKEDMEAAKAPGTDFVAAPDKKQVAGRCGGCHADVETMNFYGLPTDQLARYKTSAHGKLLFEHGDEYGAVCTDCHGTHDVVAVTDPRSPVYPLNLPATCNRCHGDQAMMAPYAHPTDIFEKYKKSVHGVALFEKGDLGAANCVKCHGSHGAMPPGVKEIGATCGKCHINEKKYFQESPHAAAAAEGYFPECAACHDYHDVQRPDTSLYNTACLNCHSEGDDAFKRGQKIKEMIDSSSGALSDAGEAVRQAALEGIFVDDESASLQEAKTDVLEMAPLQHSLSLEGIEKLYDKATALTDDIQDGVRRKRQSLRWRKVALIPLWIFIFLMVVVLREKYNQLKEKEHE